jgi:hypothetical protein
VLASAPVIAPTATTGAGILTLTLLAAVLHAVWNAIAHAVPDRLVGFTLLGLA